MSSLYVIDAGSSVHHAVSCDCLAHRFGNAGDRPVRARVYPTDLTDAQWGQIRLLIPVPGWMGGRGGRPEGFCHREMIDAVLYLVDNGIKWRAMPTDFPAWDAVYRFFGRWRDGGGLQVLHDRVRRACREEAGRGAEPSAGVIDAQSLRAAATVGADRRGFDAAKKVAGTKRHIVTDTLGLLLAVLFTPAGLHDRDGALPLLTRMRRTCLRISHLWADGGYAGRLVDCLAEQLRLHLEIVKRTGTAPGFQVLPRRWVVERTLAWISCCRRCVRDYERRTDTAEAMTFWAMLKTMIRRLGLPAAPLTPGGTTPAPARPASPAAPAA
ncbi:transposase [Catenulispora sp. GAS73]|uniref:IS5 family transposase n=1 Tax=Catenulispora sp. GAS73 TaxID=3156269 RepID=UPI0035173FA3